MNISGINPAEKVNVSKRSGSILDVEISLKPSRITGKEKELIYRQMAVLLSSGIDISTTFEILRKQIKSKKTGAKLDKLIADVISGKSLSEAMNQQSSDFSYYEIYSIKIGEESGKINQIFEQLALYFENKMAQRRQVVTALSYPVLIFGTSIGAISFMMFFIIPMFEEIFLRFSGELPGITRFILNIANSIKNNFFTGLGLIALIIATFYLLRKNEKLNLLFERIIIRIPLVGVIYKAVFMARYSESMRLLLSSSVPLLRSMEMVEIMIPFVHLQQSLKRMQAKVLQGSTFATAVEAEPIFDDQMKALMKVGEESNKLAYFFERLSKDYADSVKHKTALLGTFIEPLMIVFLGLIVGVILIAMYLPMFELSNSMDFGG